MGSTASIIQQQEGNNLKDMSPTQLCDFVQSLGNENHQNADALKLKGVNGEKLKSMSLEEIDLMLQNLNVTDASQREELLSKLKKMKGSGELSQQTTVMDDSAREAVGPCFHVLEHASTSWEETGLPSRVVHIKGFNYGINHDSPECQAAARDLIKEACPVGTKTCFVWDGDELREDGFMWAVSQVLQENERKEESQWHGEIELACFKKENEVEEVKSSWATLRANKDITIFTACHDLSWEKLGAVALEFTAAKEVYCLGGGAVVENEVMNMPDVSFKVWPISRQLGDGTYQSCALLNVKDQDNVQVQQIKSS